MHRLEINCSVEPLWQTVIPCQNQCHEGSVCAKSEDQPGDRFHLQEAGGGWNILINDEIAKNSQNQTYILDGKSHGMLFLYERDYGGVIPPGSYLILGNPAYGSLDSSRFGLIGKGDVLGKVEPAGH